MGLRTIDAVINDAQLWNTSVTIVTALWCNQGVSGKIRAALDHRYKKRQLEEKVNT